MNLDFAGVRPYLIRGASPPCRFLFAAMALLSAATVDAETSGHDSIDFARDIQPILNARCTECHGGVKAAGGVSFVYEDRVINFEGESGYPVVKPGDVDESELFYRITTDDAADRMPPAKDHAPLSKNEIDLIEKWIGQGAEWSAHWAFIPPAEPEIPEVDASSPARGAIDELLFARLEKEGLSPSPREESGRLLRRIALGLTGLPPTPGEYEAFEEALSEKGDAAVADAVDDYLGRSSFGERWATLWLDLVRYADSGGLGQDQKRTIWAYRDWVVRAFNADMPFDQFTIMQLAGDLVPDPTIDDLVATACHRNTQTNNEGGTDDETFRVEAIVDRVNTTWQTWGAITFSCVQCHDHPYDPLRHDEYYEFMDFFNNSADSDLPNEAPLLTVPADPNQFNDAARLRQQILEEKERTWSEGIALRDASDWTGLRGIGVKANNTTRYAISPKGSYDEFHTTGTVATKTHTLIDVPAKSFAGKAATALRLTVLPHDPETAIHSPEWGFVIDKLEASIVDEAGEKRAVTFRTSVPDVPWMPTDPMGLIGADGKSWGANSRIHHARALVLVPSEPLVLEDGEQLTLHIHCNRTGHGSHPMAIQRGHLAFTSAEGWTKHAPEGGEQIRADLSSLSAIKGVTVPIMQVRPDDVARPTHIFARGNAMDKDRQVAAGLPASLLEVAPAPEAPNRLDMARWWVSDDHPLTARVFVNRIWEQLMGVGIVPTLEDFGSSGAKPTHPELLDYLAIRFQESYQWSVKSIIREIVLSHAFAQSSVTSPEMAERDPDNRLLARGPRLRLTAEMIRDQSLAVSGLISNKMGGPPVHPPIPEGVWRPFEARDKWETPEPGQDDRYRRSLYTYVKRSIPYPTFASFDAPSREFCSPRRLTSNTPLQALTTLNDRAFVECAEALGRRISDEFSGTEGERLAQAYRLVTGRKADSEQLRPLVNLHKKVAAEAPEQAWTVVAQVLLSLDDTLTY